MVILLVVAIVVAVGLVAGRLASRRTAETTSEVPASETAEVGPSPTNAGPIPLAELLDRLVAAPEQLEGYERDLFPHWTDDDGDGCNTRYEVLLAEAVVEPTVVAGCDLIGGSWLSPYDGVTLDGASSVQIDHLVALAEAWYSGAYAWTTARREQFANDLGVSWALVAVSPAINEAKAANDPAEWLPPSSAAVCPYVAAWIGGKVRWALAVDPAEMRALEELVRQCPDQEVAVPLIR
jgi:hypothetical protein